MRLGKLPRNHRQMVSTGSRSGEANRTAAEIHGAVAVELTSENLRELDTAASKIALQGARYPEELQKLVGR
jgi:hypothetical protein